MVFKWAVIVGQSLPTRFEVNGAAPELVLVQIVVNCVGTRGVPHTLTRWSLYMSGSAEAFFGGYEQKYTSEWRATNYIFLSICREHDTHEFTAGSWDVYFLFWPHLFPSFTTCQKNPFATPQTVLQRAKKSLWNRSQFRTLFLPHRFIKIRPSHQRPVSIEFWHWISHNLSDARIPQIWTKSKKLGTFEFDGKERLFVERTIANSIRVLQWISLSGISLIVWGGWYIHRTSHWKFRLHIDETTFKYIIMKTVYVDFLTTF